MKHNKFIIIRNTRHDTQRYISHKSDCWKSHSSLNVIFMILNKRNVARYASSKCIGEMHCASTVGDVHSWRYARAPRVKIAINHSRTRGSANNRWLTVLCAGQSLNRPFENLCAPTSRWSPVISVCRKLPQWVWQWVRPLCDRVDQSYSQLTETKRN